jgi:hypothetical protein
LRQILLHAGLDRFRDIRGGRSVAAGQQQGGQDESHDGITARYCNRQMVIDASIMSMTWVDIFNRIARNG